MDTLNNNPKETETAPASVPTPAANSPEAAAAPIPVKASEGKPAAAPAPVEIVKGIVPTTKGNVAGGWNRFAGYKPGQSKDKQKDRRDRDSRGRR